jgi:hypothetical protein
MCILVRKLDLNGTKLHAVMNESAPKPQNGRMTLFLDSIVALHSVPFQSVGSRFTVFGITWVCQWRQHHGERDEVISPRSRPSSALGLGGNHKD